MATAAAVGHGHPPTTTGLDHRKIAIWAFIGSECMLFTSLISTYLVYKGRSVTGPFPHEVCNPPQCATTLQPILNIPVSSAENVLAVPLSAVFTERNERYVFVKDGESFVRRPVIVGLTDFFYAEVQQGLSEGDVVSLEQVVDSRVNGLPSGPVVRKTLATGTPTPSRNKTTPAAAAPSRPTAGS